MMNNLNNKQSPPSLLKIGMMGYNMLSEEDLRELLGEGDFEEALRDDE